MSIIIIIIFFLLAVSLLLLKIFELKRERTIFVTNIIIKLDPLAISIREGIDAIVLASPHIMKDLQRNLSDKLWTMLRDVTSIIKRVSDKMHDSIHGKGTIKEKTHASFFLQSVADHKKHLRDENK